MPMRMSGDGRSWDDTGNTVGTVDGLMVDDDQNKVRFLQVECGGFLGLGATHVMIPVDAIIGITGDAVTIDRDGRHLRGAPRYHPSAHKGDGRALFGAESTTTTDSRRIGGGIRVSEVPIQ